MEVASHNLPERLANRTFIAIIASHLQRHPEWSNQWRDRLICALIRCRDEQKVVLFNTQTPIGFWIAQFARQLDVTCLSVQSASNISDDRVDEFKVILRPLKSSLHVPGPEMDALPLADRTIFALASELAIIELAKESKTLKMVKRWVEDLGDIEPTATIRTFDSVSETLVRSVISEPGISLVLNNLPGSTATQPVPTMNRSRSELEGLASAMPILPYALFETSRLSCDEYLVHCTRGRDGRYPNQSEQAYASEMLMLEGDIQSEPIETLRQILSARRIIATRFLKRSDVASVSFSAVPLLELLRRRHYRSHLKRWDWEPFGIAIRKQTLIDRFQAAQVQYRSEDDYANLSSDLRWLFQPRSSLRNDLDWSAEQEWRCPGDVRLARLGPLDGFVFVPDVSSAKWIAKNSPFPVAIVNQEQSVGG